MAVLERSRLENIASEKGEGVKLVLYRLTYSGRVLVHATLHITPGDTQLQSNCDDIC